MIMEIKSIKSIKGTDTTMRCRGFQFEPGKIYSLPEGESVTICKTGFHACPAEQHPLSVFKFYPPAGSRYFDVIQSGDMQHDGNKTASQTIEIGPEISIADLVQRAVDFVKATGTAKIGSHATGTWGAASATGTWGAASATGTQGAASATGAWGAASATGTWGAASATGEQGAASATGEYSAAMATGIYGRVMGGIDGVSLFAREMILVKNKYNLASVACGITGRDGIKAGVWYVCKNGKLVEAE